MSNASISSGRIGRLIFYELEHGDSRDHVVDQLVGLGIEPEDARYMVDSACCCRRVGLLVDGARHQKLGGRLALTGALLGAWFGATELALGLFIAAMSTAFFGGMLYLRGMHEHSEADRIEARHPRRPSSHPARPWPARVAPRSRPEYLRPRGVGLGYHVRPRGEESHFTLRT